MGIEQQPPHTPDTGQQPAHARDEGSEEISVDREFVWTIQVPVTQRELDVIRDLEQKQDLDERGVVLQALRLYQSVCAGHAKVTWPPQHCKIIPELHGE